jgi:hypothetical protein
MRGGLIWRERPTDDQLTHVPPSSRFGEPYLSSTYRNTQGSRLNFRYDPEAPLFMRAGLLPEGRIFSFDFGFIPSPLGEDNDPLDIMVMLEAPAKMGCLIEVRIRVKTFTKAAGLGRSMHRRNCRSIIPTRENRRPGD